METVVSLDNGNRLEEYQCSFRNVRNDLARQAGKRVGGFFSDVNLCIYEIGASRHRNISAKVPHSAQLLVRVCVIV